MMYGSPMVNSTPGGMEIGVRPSLERCAADAEKGRLADGALLAASAGTRNDGRVAVGEAHRAAALARLGASIVCVSL